MTKIRQDRHGPYVRTGGYLFRPVETPHSCHFNMTEFNKTAFEVGADVVARHRGGTPYGVVRANGIEEWWHSHGDYMGKDTEDCWNPSRRISTMENSELARLEREALEAWETQMVGSPR